jgi:hypothetical protein
LELCYYLYEFCKKKGNKRAKLLKEHSLLTYGVFHLARVFAFYAFGSEDLRKDAAEIVSILHKLRTDHESFDDPFNKAVKLCLRVLLRKAKAASANNYFKSQVAQQQITDAVGKARAHEVGESSA